MRAIPDRFLAAVLLGAIRLYRIAVAPLLPRACRFYPSCSTYASEAIRAHGGGRGARMAVNRVLRCHPFHQGGFDPVPASKGAPE